jgi:Transposase DNA-binding
MLSRNFRELKDTRLVGRANKILLDLFRKNVHSIRQITKSEADAKGFYRFLRNKKVSEADIIHNMKLNCIDSCQGKQVICIQDTTEINLSSHGNRIKRDEYIGATNEKGESSLGFFIHPSLVVDACNGTPYGFSEIKIWNRPLVLKNKKERKYGKLPIEEKESFKWIEVSQNTQKALSDVVDWMLIIQDREGDIYEQIATIPNNNTDLLIRARSDRNLADNTKMYESVGKQKSAGTYEINVEACLKTKRKKRTAKLQVRYKEVELTRPTTSSKHAPATQKIFIIEAKEINYKGEDPVCWRLLTTININCFERALDCIEWYTWRWTIEEVFKVLKKEGFNIEASELESAFAIRKLSLIIMEVVIKLFLLRLSYFEPELEIAPITCFTKEEILCLEQQIKRLEGKTEKQKNPYTNNQLSRYTWVIARLGGWKGYASERKPGITTLWNGLKEFNAIMVGWESRIFVSTR